MESGEVRVIRCPGCGGPSRYAPDNPYRPFCGKACRAHDLGAWASESYRVASTPGAGNETEDEDEPPSH